MILQVGVKILIYNEQKQCLVLRRSLTKYPDINGRWDIVGGRIEPGTPLLDNLKREIKEETNLDLAGTPCLVAAQDILRSADRHTVRLTYVGQATGQLVLDTAENDQSQWLTLDELRALDDLDVYLKELFTGVYDG